MEVPWIHFVLRTDVYSFVPPMITVFFMYCAYAEPISIFRSVRSEARTKERNRLAPLAIILSNKYYIFSTSRMLNSTYFDLSTKCVFQIFLTFSSDLASSQTLLILAMQILNCSMCSTKGPYTSSLPTSEGGRAVTARQLLNHCCKE